MAYDKTSKVPDTHTVLPQSPEDNFSSQPYIAPAVQTSDSGKSAGKSKSKDAAEKLATSHLKKRNRKRNRLSVTMPITLEVQAGTRLTAKGFAPMIDGDWVVEDMEIHINAKGGSETRIQLHVTPDVGPVNNNSQIGQLQQQYDKEQVDQNAVSEVDDPAFFDNADGNTSGSPTPSNVQSGKQS
jgi:hypothetical protein